MRTRLSLLFLVLLICFSLIPLLRPRSAAAHSGFATGPSLRPANPVTTTQTLSDSISLLAAPLPPTSVETTGPYIKGIYMTYHAAGHDGLRTHALDMIDQTELNALVLDIKGDLGLLTYQSEVITATAIGANDTPMILDWPAFMKDLKERNIYAIARIVVFKDNYLARAHPEWAVKDGAGNLWFDGENLPWLEPFHEEVWDYNIALAVEAAQRGFDEVQFDYVRFPTDGAVRNIAYSQPAGTAQARTEAIVGLLAKARAALAPYPTKLSADVFGYTTWYQDDFGIGQDLALMAPHLDVLSPMLYPSTYSAGLPGLPEYYFAIAHPYPVVYHSTLRALSRVKAANPHLVVRPWIQDFADYAFDGRTYTPQEIRAQMLAAYDAGGGGWLMWDPRVRYTPEALVSASPVYETNETGDILVLRYTGFGAEDGDGQRSLAGFRSDLEALLAAGYYPINLRDLTGGASTYQKDLAQLRQQGWTALQIDERRRGRLNHVPEGKRPIVLTFDGGLAGQYRLLADGSLDPASALGVLYAFHLEHPADWPLRATFFIQPEPGAFGQPDWTTQKIQNLRDWGMEVGLYYPVDGATLATSAPSKIRHHLAGRRTALETMLGGDEITSLALRLPLRLDRHLQRKFEEAAQLNFAMVTQDDEQPVPSPHTGRFDPHRLSRVAVTPETVDAWLAFYEQNRNAYYVASGVIPVVRAVE